MMNSSFESLGIVSGEKKTYSGVYLDQGLSFEQARDRYEKRRRDYLKDLKHPTLLMGVDREYGHLEVWQSYGLPVNQEPILVYLTGIIQANVALYLNPKNGQVVLYLPKRDRDFEFWNGARLGVGDSQSVEIAKVLTGIDVISNIDEMVYELSEEFKRENFRDLGLFWYEGVDTRTKSNRVLEGSNLRTYQKIRKDFEQKGCALSYHNVMKYSMDKRLSLDETDIENIRRAVEIHFFALKRVFKEAKTFKNEREVVATLLYEIGMRSSFGLSFSTIAGSGRNATNLHYGKNDDAIESGDLFLIDSGVRFHSMLSDVTRVFPTNGRFDPLQSLIYGIVLDVQKEVETKIAPGVRYGDLDQWAWTRMGELLEERFLKKGGKATFSYDKKPHGLGHLLGEMIHDGDPFRNYLEEPMREGWVITNEPGIYGYFEMEIEGRLYRQHLGIRIEDDLLVTKTGCTNLTKSIPKEIVDIENEMRL